MFCPKCSRPIAEGVQFCQQCGLALGGVKRLLDADGVEAEAAAVVKKGTARSLSPRRKGYRLGFKLVLLALVFLPFYPLVEGLLESLIPSVENSRLDELPLELFGTALFFLFVGGLLRMLYARLFESGEAPAESEAEGDEGGTKPGIFSAFSRRALPPSRSIPVEDFNVRRVDTADLARPRSVTEHTTGSLRPD